MSEVGRLKDSKDKTEEHWRQASCLALLEVLAQGKEAKHQTVCKCWGEHQVSIAHGGNQRVKGQLIT